MTLNRLFKLTSFLTVLFAAFLSSGCEKSANTTVYEWSATIDGVNYSYSMPSYPSSDGGNVLFQLAASSSGSTILLNDEGTSGNTAGYPQIAISSTNSQLNVGTYTFNSQSNSTTAFGISMSSSLSNPNLYSTITPNAQVTLNITSVGSVGGLVEGNFSGTVGKVSTTPPYTISYINVSGNFKAYRER